jgi:molecular chaperone HscB
MAQGGSQCWSCGEPRGAQDALCPKCGKVQPPPPAGSIIDNFAILGLPQTFEIDLALLEERFRALSRRLHPDKFARAEAKERRFSLEQTTLLNNAYRTLKDPLKRAQSLLRLHGIDASGEPGPNKEQVPMEFLEEAMEDRERLVEARVANSAAEVQKIGDDVRKKRDGALTEIAAALHEQAWQKAAPIVSRLRYYARFLDEVEERERGFE